MLNENKGLLACFYAKISKKPGRETILFVAYLLFFGLVVGLAVFFFTEPMPQQPVFSVAKPIIIEADSPMEKGMQVQVPFAGFGIDFNKLADLNCTFFVDYKGEAIQSKQSISGEGLYFWLQEPIEAGAIDTYKMNFECK